MPRDMYIPGLDDGGKLGSARENEIFDLEPEGISHSVKLKEFQAPHAKGEGTITGNVGSLQTAFNMLKVFIGIGILATPASFRAIGIIGGIFGMILVGSLNAYTMRLQIESKIKLNKPINSYSELGLYALGDGGKRFVDICIMVSQIGFVISYLLFIGK